MICSRDIAPTDPPDSPEEPLRCPGCSATGDAPCDRGCIYADDPGHTIGYVAATSFDIAHDEAVTSSRWPSDPPAASEWDAIF